MLICDSPIGTFPNYNIMIQFVPLGQIGMLHKYYMLSMSMGENDLLPQAFASYFYVMSRNDKFRQFWAYNASGEALNQINFFVDY